MKLHQFEVWKARPPGFETDHWFVLISGQDGLAVCGARRSTGWPVSLCAANFSRPMCASTAPMGLKRRRFANAILFTRYTSRASTKVAAWSVGNASRPSRPSSKRSSDSDPSVLHA